MCCLEAADRARDCISERAALVAEQLGFDEHGGNRGRVDATHRTISPGTGSVYGPGEHLLADAGLAQEQHRRVGGCHEG